MSDDSGVESGFSKKDWLILSETNALFGQVPRVREAFLHREISSDNADHAVWAVVYKKLEEMYESGRASHEFSKDRKERCGEAPWV